MTSQIELLPQNSAQKYTFLSLIALLEWICHDRSTIVRADQHSAGAKDSSTEQENIGRSAGGLSTKIHGTVDALGNPTHFF